MVQSKAAQAQDSCGCCCQGTDQLETECYGKCMEFGLREAGRYQEERCGRQRTRKVQTTEGKTNGFKRTGGRPLIRYTIRTAHE